MADRTPRLPRPPVSPACGMVDGSPRAPPSPRAMSDGIPPASLSRGSPSPGSSSPGSRVQAMAAGIRRAQQSPGSPWRAKAEGISRAQLSPRSPWRGKVDGLRRLNGAVSVGDATAMAHSGRSILTRGTTGRGLLSQASIGTRKRRGQWWAPIEVGVDFVPDSQDGSGGEFIFIPDSEVDVMAFIQDHKSREKMVEDEAMKLATKRADLQKRVKRRYQCLPSLEEELSSFLLYKRGVDGKLRSTKEIEAEAMEHRQPGVDIGGHSQADDDMLDDELLLDKESQPMVSPFSLTRSSSMFKSGTPTPPAPVVVEMSSYGPPATTAAAAGISPYGPPPPASASDVGMFRSGSPPPAGTSSSSKPGGLLRSKAMSLSKRVGDEEMK